MRVLVTGSAGFIGSHLVQLLRSRGGMEVAEFDIKDSPLQDVRSLDAVAAAAKGAAAIVHLAALCLDPESVQKPLEYFTTNVIGTFNVLDAARQLGIRKVINASSAAIEGSTPYGVSKLCGEKLCESYAKTYGIRAASLRFYNVYGGGNDKGVIFEFFNRVKARQTIVIYDDGEYVRDYVHVRDVINIIERFLEDNAAEPGVYEVGTGTGTSVNQLVDLIEEVAGARVERAYESCPYNRVRRSVSTATCVRDPLQLREGLKEMWAGVAGK
ncbi:MAG: NAD-dependent epimerase/dehydratase family protein [Candidatus Aenigmatarchaeota archaeon]